MYTDNTVEVKQGAIAELPLFLTVEELAGILRIGRNSAYQLVKQGRINCIHIGRAILIPRASVDAFINGAMTS